MAKARLAEIDAWETERLVAVTEQVRGEANKRRAGTRAEACAAVKLLQENGETLTGIAKLTGDDIGEVRAMLLASPRTLKPTARNGSVAVSGVSDAAPVVSPGGGAAGVFDVASDERLPVGAGAAGRDHHATQRVHWARAPEGADEGARARLLPRSGEQAPDD